MEQQHVLIIGTGRLALSVLRSLRTQISAVVARSDEGVARVRAISPEMPCLTTLSDAVELEFDTVWILVRDDQISDVALQLSRVPVSWGSRLVVHSSGARTTEALLALASMGCVTAVMHPNGVFSGRTPIDSGLTWGLSSDLPGSSLDRIRQLLSPLSPRFVYIADAARPLYHAAASCASNYVGLLIAVAQDLYRRSGVADSDASRIVSDFVRQCNASAMHYGPTEALTGPIVRGDWDVVELQLRTIRTAAPVWYSLFEACAGALAAIVDRRDGSAER